MHITILMAMRNGAPYLPAQLDSIARQTWSNWSLVVSDDGSDDGSADIVRQFAARMPAGKVTLRDGPCQGGVANFMSLLRRTPCPGGLAFADQDDVWLTDHLQRAVTALASHRLSAAVPLAFACRLQVCDETLRPTRLTPLPRRPLGFANALVQNVISGNASVFDAQATALLQQAAAEATLLPVVHDWWAYLMVTGAGGGVVFDPHPTVMYRQHGTNLIGANTTVRSRIARLSALLRGQQRQWLIRNGHALDASRHRLTPDSTARLDLLMQAVSARWPQRIGLFRQAGVYRQTRMAHLAMWSAILTGRL